MRANVYPNSFTTQPTLPAGGTFDLPKQEVVGYPRRQMNSNSGADQTFSAAARERNETFRNARTLKFVDERNIVLLVAGPFIERVELGRYVVIKDLATGGWKTIPWSRVVELNTAANDPIFRT